MAKTLRFVSTSSLLTFSAATLVAAALTLKNARRYVELAETRMGYLREEQAHLLAFVREEHRTLKEESRREREQRLEAQQETERLSREFLQLRQKQGHLAEELERERAKYLEDRQQARQQARREREKRERERRNAERKIEQLKRELQELREIQQNREAQRKREMQELRESQQEREIKRVSSPSVSAGLSETREHPAEEASSTQRVVREAGRTPPRPASSLETRASEPAKVPPKNEKARLGVRMPHPEDRSNSGRASAGRARSGASDEMFRKYYDKYLENYAGYVELAEALYQTRDNGGITPDSFGEREWEERLRRVNDGIERTTVRLDILEEHNPELATDDRISQRASVARRHLELKRRSGAE
jgi:hypothetical protein